MRAGGGHAKGAAWEREVGRRLSLWLTNGARPDIFSRNVLSGGAFTVASKAGKLSSRMPGDLMAAHPLAFEFLSRFLVECKHLHSLHLEAYLFDVGGRGMLSTIIELCERQAREAGLDYLIIAKQDRREPLALVSGRIGKGMLIAQQTGRTTIIPAYHLLHRQRVLLMELGPMLRFVKPQAFLGSKP